MSPYYEVILLQTHPIEISPYYKVTLFIRLFVASLNWANVGH